MILDQSLTIMSQSIPASAWPIPAVSAPCRCWNDSFWFFYAQQAELTGVLDLVRNATEYRRQPEDLRPLMVFSIAIPYRSFRAKTAWTLAVRGWAHQRVRTTFWTSIYRSLCSEEMSAWQILWWSAGPACAAIFLRWRNCRASWKAWQQTLINTYLSDLPGKTDPHGLTLGRDIGGKPDWICHSDCRYQKPTRK